MRNINLTPEQKKTLIKIARQSIISASSGLAAPEYQITNSVLNTACGAFVTLHNNNGALRGCIGNITTENPLWETVRNMAAEAALRDPRFPPVSTREAGSIYIEISVLSPLQKIKSLEQIEVGKHGLFIKKDYYQGLLLPQVAIEHRWNRIKFLEQTCYKAGLSRDCYKQKNCEIFIFSAAVFGERDSGDQPSDK